ncbi:hypothetical protein D3C80_1526580 [compost metagenome]
MIKFEVVAHQIGQGRRIAAVEHGGEQDRVPLGDDRRQRRLVRDGRSRGGALGDSQCGDKSGDQGHGAVQQQ